MSSSARRIMSSLLVAALLGPLSIARAEDSESPRPREDDTRKPVTVTVNPLGLAIQRYSANVEVVPFAHHAFVGSLYSQSMPVWLIKDVSGRDEINPQTSASLGGELGYRLYSGSVGADGLFVGASFVSMPLAYPRLGRDLASADLVRFSALGAAFDIGLQKVTRSGFTFGGGVGVMYLDYQVPSDVRRIAITVEPHVWPRLLLMTGWSF
jgi:hypothetical protein